jgi:selenide,water dikinase
VAVIGGGVAGVELALALRQRFERELGDATVELMLLQRTADLLPGAGAGLRQRGRQVLAERGIRVICGAAVTAVAPGLELQLESGDRLPCDLAVWATGAAAPSWLAASGLALDAAGFVRVGPSLQSLSHPRVFASGDVAGFSPPLPKAGVYAVRQGPILAENLRRAIAGLPLRPYRPQRQVLVLLGTGRGTAIAARGAWSAGPAPLWWWLKQRIDRAFMARFGPD